MSLTLLLRSSAPAADSFEISAGNLVKLRSDRQHSRPLLAICPPGTTMLYISEDNNDTTRRWSAGYRLLVLDEFAIWAKYLRVIDEDTYKQDWDVTYSDQHDHPKPVIRFGPPLIPE